MSDTGTFAGLSSFRRQNSCTLEKGSSSRLEPVELAGRMFKQGYSDEVIAKMLTHRLGISSARAEKIMLEIRLAA